MRPLRFVLSSVLVGLAFASCSRPTEGGVLVIVSFSRTDASPACLLLTVTDLLTLTDPAPRRRTLELPIQGKGTSGAVTAAIGHEAGWSKLLQLTASLHLGSCAAPASVSVTREVSINGNTISSIELLISQPSPDGGPVATDGDRADAGTSDAGPRTDAGPMADAGAGAGADAGQDGGGAPDAGARDAGGFDAGPSCMGTFVNLTTPLSRTVNDIAMYNDSVAMLAGPGAFLYAMTPSGLSDRWSNVGMCPGDFTAVWVRQNFHVFVATTSGVLHRFEGPGTCSPAVSGIKPGTPTAIGAYPFGAGMRLWVSSRDPAALTKIELNSLGNVVGDDAGTISEAADGGFPFSSAWGVRGVAGTSDLNVFAVAFDGSNGTGHLFTFRPVENSWAEVALPSPAGRLRAIDFVDDTAGFAGGEQFWVFNGSSWSLAAPPSFEIFALKAFTATDVVAVGGATSNAVARWNGTSWATMPVPAGSGLLTIDGTSACDSWSAGGAQLVTSHH